MGEGMLHQKFGSQASAWTVKSCHLWADFGMQTSPTVVYAGFSYPPDLGTTLRFYDVVRALFLHRISAVGI